LIERRTPLAAAALDPGADPVAFTRSFRAVMGHFATGVAIVTFLRDQKPAGITVNSFLPVSIDPPLVLVSLRRESRVTRQLGVGVRYAVNVLAEGQQALSARFSRSHVDDDPLDFEFSAGTPLLRGSLAHIVGRVVDVHAVGDHFLHIAEVEQLIQATEARPLIFHAGAYKRVRAHEPGENPGDGLDGW